MTSDSLILNRQYVKDLSFENPKAPFVFLDEEKKEIDLSIDITAAEVDKKVHEVVLSIVAKAVKEKEVIFLADLKYACVCTIEKTTNLEKLLFVHCPHIIFPYARKIITDAIQEGGFPNFFIAPMDFENLYLENKKKAKK
jgi:preprotein translocase subunit SecB